MKQIFRTSFKGMPLRVIAKETGISHSAIANAFKGKGDVSLRTFIALATHPKVARNATVAGLLQIKFPEACLDKESSPLLYAIATIAETTDNPHEFLRSCLMDAMSKAGIE